MIVWITHVKVGHRQTPIKRKAQPCVGLFALWYLIRDLLEFMTTRAKGACCGVDSYRPHRCDVETKVGHRQTPINRKALLVRAFLFTVFGVVLELENPLCALKSGFAYSIPILGIW